MWKRAIAAWAMSGVALVALSGRAAAQAPNTETETGTGGTPHTEQSAEAGMFLPYTMAPRTDSQTAFALGLGGYDFARESALAEATADATVFGPLALRLGVVYTQTPKKLRPTAGARVQALDQEDHSIDMSIGAFYRPEGFTEAEGEIELVVAFGRRFGRWGTFANLIYGQDPEARERDGEVKLAALYAFDARLQGGLDSRLRFDLGSDEEKRLEEGEAEYDFIAGPTLSYSLDAVALVATAGISGVGQQTLKAGPVLLGGIAGSL